MKTLPPPYLAFSIMVPHRATVAHAIFTRHGGISVPPLDSLNVSYSVKDNVEAVGENRRRCAAALGMKAAALTTAGLVHGATVGLVDRPPAERLPDGSGIVPDVDALITARPGQGLLITAADCLQVVFVDPQTPAIGLAHAGWRGLVAGVLSATVAAMNAAFGSKPDQLLVGIGPGLGPCCARFSDPTHELPASFRPYIHGHYADLWTAARHELLASGTPNSQIEQQAICTVCQRDRFFSHRGDSGRTGRFAAIVALVDATPGGEVALCGESREAPA